MGILVILTHPPAYHKIVNIMGAFSDLPAILNFSLLLLHPGFAGVMTFL
jgi:hypothetical protein